MGTDRPTPDGAGRPRPRVERRRPPRRPVATTLADARIDDRLHGRGASAAPARRCRRAARSRRAVVRARHRDRGAGRDGSALGARLGQATTTTTTSSVSPLPSTNSRAAERRLLRARRMLRITELRLPLDHAEDALRAAIVARLGIATPTCAPSPSSSAATTRARRAAIVLIYTVDCDVRRRSRRCSRASPATRTCGPRPTPRYRFVGHAPADFRASGRAAPGRRRLRPVRPVRRADPGADGPARRSCWSAARRCASAPRTPGACGAAASSIPSRTCSSAKAAPAPSPTASCGARSATRAT